MRIIAETHCHTVACDHAYSTITENAREAARLGIPFLCITEHGSAMPDAPHEWFFLNLCEVLPERIEGTIVLRGAEVNIMDYDGRLDIPDRLLHRLDWVIASYHTACLEPTTVQEHTRGWLAVAENPLVDVIGHCGDGRYPFDHEVVVQAFAKHNKIVEINAHSFEARPGSTENCRAIAMLCKKHGVRIVCSSDAHYHGSIGKAERALPMLREIGFPEELIVNADYDRFLEVARACSGRMLTE